MIQKVGFESVVFRNETLGIVAIHSGTKPRDN
jgi:ubiquinone/menaquinone biosynthesis C-methylase UbiE